MRCKLLQFLHPKHKHTEALTKSPIFNVPIPQSEPEDVRLCE